MNMKNTVRDVCNFGWELTQPLILILAALFPFKICTFAKQVSFTHHQFSTFFCSHFSSQKFCRTTYSGSAETPCFKSETRMFMRRPRARLFSSVVTP